MKRTPIERRTPMRRNTPPGNFQRGPQPKRSRSAVQRERARAWKADRKESEILFGQIVRSAPWCLYCGQPRGLQCAHIMRRGHNLTRCDLKNAVALCGRCHTQFTTGAIVEWAEWIDNAKGPGYYQMLHDRAHAKQTETNSTYWAAKRSELTALWAEIKATQ